MGVGIKITSGPVLDKPGDLAGLLTNLSIGDVLFIDEIHRLSPVIEEYLYSAMEAKTLLPKTATIKVEAKTLLHKTPRWRFVQWRFCR